MSLTYYQCATCGDESARRYGTYELGRPTKLDCACGGFQLINTRKERRPSRGEFGKSMPVHALPEGHPDKYVRSEYEAQAAMDKHGIYNDPNAERGQWTPKSPVGEARTPTKRVLDHPSQKAENILRNYQQYRGYQGRPGPKAKRKSD